MDCPKGQVCVSGECVDKYKLEMTYLTDVRMSGDTVLATIEVGNIKRTYPIEDGRSEWVDMWKNGGNEDRELLALWVGNEIKIPLYLKYMIYSNLKSKYWDKYADEAMLMNTGVYEDLTSVAIKHFSK